jgi:ACS family tartrate transporter-like MFS transporter
MLMIAEQLSPSPVSMRARRRIVRRLMPYLFFIYVIAYLDRVNVGFAALGMTGDLGFAPHVVGTGGGIFFLGYFLLEIPGTILVEKWSARGWIARVMISWGILAILTGFIRTPSQFYWIRFLLGAAEAGFFPGVIVYLTHWFRYEDRAKAVAMFMAAIPISQVIGAPASGALLKLNWMGLAGWRWLFILEGAPAVIFGVVTIFYLTDWPHQAKWLADDERDWIISELEIEKQQKQVHQHRVNHDIDDILMRWIARLVRDKSGLKVIRAFLNILRSLGQPAVLILALAYFFIVTSNYGLIFWLPTMLKKLSGLTNFQVGLVSALPYCAGLAAMLIVGWSSDRTRERRWHTAGPMMVACLGLFLAALAQSSTPLTVAVLCVAAMGINSYLPGFWALPTTFLTGTAAAASIGLINSIGNLGGFAGPYIVGRLVEATGSFFGGVIYLSMSALTAALLILALRRVSAKPKPSKGAEPAGV